MTLDTVDGATFDSLATSLIVMAKAPHPPFKNFLTKISYKFIITVIRLLIYPIVKIQLVIFLLERLNT
jgi:hypothetical protein